MARVTHLSASPVGGNPADGPVLDHLEHAFRIASDSAHFYSLITPAGFESFFDTVGRPWAGPFDGDMPIPAAPSPEAIGVLAATLGPLGVTITGPPPFD
jgi:hypothetical protein